VSAINQHGDMIAISAHLKLEADLKDQIYELEHENAGLRVELEQQAICNGAGAERELALRSTIAELQRENLALRADKERLDSGRVRLMTWSGDSAWELCDFVDVDLRAAIDAARKEQP